MKRGGHHGMHLTDVHGVAKAVLSTPDKGAANYVGYIFDSGTDSEKA